MLLSALQCVHVIQNLGTSHLNSLRVCRVYNRRNARGGVNYDIAVVVRQHRDGNDFHTCENAKDKTYTCNRLNHVLLDRSSQSFPWTHISIWVMVSWAYRSWLWATGRMYLYITPFPHTAAHLLRVLIPHKHRENTQISCRKARAKKQPLNKLPLIDLTCKKWRHPGHTTKLHRQNCRVSSRVAFSGFPHLPLVKHVAKTGLGVQCVPNKKKNNIFLKRIIGGRKRQIMKPGQIKTLVNIWNHDDLYSSLRLLLGL